MLYQCGRGVPQRDAGGGLHHDGDGPRLGGVAGGGEGGQAVRGAEPGLPAAAEGVRAREPGRSERRLAPHSYGPRDFSRCCFRYCSCCDGPSVYFHSVAASLLRTMQRCCKTHLEDSIQR